MAPDDDRSRPNRVSQVSKRSVRIFYNGRLSYIRHLCRVAKTPFEEVSCKYIFKLWVVEGGEFH